MPSCDNCTKPFPGLPAAPHKRFCSEACRTSWHTKRRQEALKGLREMELSEAKTLAAREGRRAS